MNCPIALIAQLGISFFELLQVGSYKSYCMRLLMGLLKMDINGGKLMGNWGYNP